MAYAPAGLTDCPDIQAELDSLFVTCNSSLLREPTPLFDFLMSDVNRSGYGQMVSPGGGKLKTVVYRYDQRLLESAVTQPGSCDRTCVATTQRGDLTGSCTIDPCDFWQVEEVINTQDFTYACRTNPEIIAKKLQIMLNGLMAKIATEVTEQAVALLGNWNALVDDTPGVTVSADFLQLATELSGGTIDPKAFATLDLAFKQTQYCNGAAIFSGATLYQYFQLMRAGCCSTQGIDLAQIMSLYGMGIQYDHRVQKAFADVDKAIAIMPGALQVVTYNENDNGIAEAAGVTVGTNYQKRIIFDPATNFPVDLTLSDNCGNLSIFMRGNPKVCGLPTDLFATGDDMEGVVYVNGIEVANA